MDGDDKVKQAVLKERYLRFLAGIPGCPADIELCESTNVQATIVAVQPNSENIIVENLKTPIGVLDSAVIRSSDVVRIRVNAEEMKMK